MLSSWLDVKSRKKKEKRGSMGSTDKRTDGCSRPLCIHTQIPLKF